MVKKYGRTIQEHHITYSPEKTVKVFKGEHELITKMNRYSKRTVSKGFLRCLRLFIKENRDRAVKL
jgi:hypothetical protein